jgi:phosphoserine phosphatase RsbU/P
VLLSDGIYEYTNSEGEAFGEARVQDVVARHGNGSMASLSAAILEVLHAFAAGAPQEDDITVVLVRREAAP